MNTLLASPQTVRQQVAGFWGRLLQDESLQVLSPLEQLVTGCEIIAALEDLELLEDFSK